MVTNYGSTPENCQTNCITPTALIDDAVHDFFVRYVFNKIVLDKKSGVKITVHRMYSTGKLEGIDENGKTVACFIKDIELKGVQDVAH